MFLKILSKIALCLLYKKACRGAADVLGGWKCIILIALFWKSEVSLLWHYVDPRFWKFQLTPNYLKSIPSKYLLIFQHIFDMNHLRKIKKIVGWCVFFLREINLRFSKNYSASLPKLPHFHELPRVAAGQVNSFRVNERGCSRMNELFPGIIII